MTKSFIIRREKMKYSLEIVTYEIDTAVCSDVCCMHCSERQQYIKTNLSSTIGGRVQFKTQSSFILKISRTNPRGIDNYM